MMPSIVMQTIENRSAAEEAIRRRHYGVIETGGGELIAIHFRLWPKLIAWPEVWPAGPVYHASGAPDRCLLYYNQPWRFPNFLALKYIVSTRETSCATIRAALMTLDGVARTKGTDALLCDAFNTRLSDWLMKRLGWQPHRPQRWHRNYVKRFYGCYPDISVPWRAAEPVVASTPAAELAL
ncbi:MAG: hypothetical protein IH898_11190 [Planctomycetes bacterium]|nr:hypothetical protein [Planctomycetota bacterium]